MRNVLLALSFVCSNVFAEAQKLNKISIEASYGLTGNLFVINYPENAPPPIVQFYKKNFIGSIGGVELKYKLSNKSNIGLGYLKSVNKREINYNSQNISIVDFNISHTNYFFQFFYERKTFKDIHVQGGLFYLRSNQQEIDASPFGVGLEERNYKNSKLEEGGVFLGFHYSKKIDTKFDLGIKSRVYYLLSTSSFEAVTLTPTLTYHF